MCRTMKRKQILKSYTEAVLQADTTLNSTEAAKTFPKEILNIINA